MSEAIALFFNHSQHKLEVEGLKVPLDVLAFEGNEWLSQPFQYQVEFTSAVQDIPVEQMLNRDATFSLNAPPQKPPPRGFTVPVVKPLRTLHGVITAFKRLSESRDEARYQITLEPRLALLGRGKQYRIYQQQSVPEIVENVLRSRHEFRGQHFLFKLAREYPRREQVMQYGESDLAFISRLLAEVGIWYRLVSDDRLRISVVELHDDQRFYQFNVKLPCRPPSGLSSNSEEAVWALQASHQVVEQRINFRAYHHREAGAYLDGEVDQTRGATTTYGEAYHYGEPYSALGEPYAQDEDLLSESGFFYARLKHERYLNGQTHLSGASSSASLAPGQVLKISGSAPQAFAPGAVITRVHTRAARDRSLETCFEAIPYAETICFRPTLLPKPHMAGTLPARVTSSKANDPYGHIDLEGRYRVSFLFDRDSWNQGQESAWLRLARPYAGDTHGLHLPLICGTEVAVAFEQGDPDRPYIAHALHDSRHPDHVTLRNYKRNVLRTPANNKLRMDDTRGEEHIKLSSEHGGKSQLNLGHVVDAGRDKRGEGFELRTDAWGAIRGGKGLFITADQQPQAQGQVLNMREALAQLNHALHFVTSLAQSAEVSGALGADVETQRNLRQALANLKEAGLIASAPAGMALTSPQSLQLSTGKNLIATASDSAELTVRERLSVAVGGAISLFAQKLGIKLLAAKGPVRIQALRDAMTLEANQDMTVNAVNGEMLLNAPQGITLTSRGAYIKLKDGSVEIGATGELRLRNDHIQWGGAASLDKALGETAVQDPVFKTPTLGKFLLRDDQSGAPRPNVHYRIEVADGSVVRGVTDSEGYTQAHHGLDSQAFKLTME
ncbi:type VI secretion system Vgr family protein [Pseudomonas inefficax]|uniref:type VI secretion system Vgr family protein n=1 Tax=Pseudomonas inefficax TaxID=2078786 RepID=UPI0040468AC3